MLEVMCDVGFKRRLGCLAGAHFLLKSDKCPEREAGALGH